MSANFTGSYSQTFDSLATTGINNTALPTGWVIAETGGGARDNEQYAADNGGTNTGDTYSYGAIGAPDRALGGLQTGTLIPLWGRALPTPRATPLPA